MAITAPKLDAREEHFRLAGPHPGLQLFLRYLPAPVRRFREPRNVLYVHGATFPSALSIAHRFDGRSWRDALNEAGFDVWGLDFHGFGFSDRYPEMSQPADGHPPLCGAADASLQIEAAARFILARRGAERLSLVSHSWGSMPAGHFAGSHPALVDCWVLFGPIAQRGVPSSGQATADPAWRIISLAAQWSRFIEDVPQGEPAVLSATHFAEWGERYLDSEPESRSRDPHAVKVPAGPAADIQLAWQGELAYEPGLVRAPVAIIRGEWDHLIPDEDARSLFDAFTASPQKRDIKINRGTHLMHLEEQRSALYDATNAFLAEGAA